MINRIELQKALGELGYPANLGKVLRDMNSRLISLSSAVATGGRAIAGEVRTEFNSLDGITSHVGQVGETSEVVPTSPASLSVVVNPGQVRVGGRVVTFGQDVVTIPKPGDPIVAEPLFVVEDRGDGLPAARTHPLQTAVNPGSVVVRSVGSNGTTILNEGTDYSMDYPMGEFSLIDGAPNTSPGEFLEIDFTPSPGTWTVAVVRTITFDQSGPVPVTVARRGGTFHPTRTMYELGFATSGVQVAAVGPISDSTTSIGTAEIQNDRAVRRDRQGDIWRFDEFSGHRHRGRTGDGPRIAHPDLIPGPVSDHSDLDDSGRADGFLLRYRSAFSEWRAEDPTSLVVGGIEAVFDEFPGVVSTTSHVFVNAFSSSKTWDSGTFAFVWSLEMDNHKDKKASFVRVSFDGTEIAVSDASASKDTASEFVTAAGIAILSGIVEGTHTVDFDVRVSKHTGDFRRFRYVGWRIQ